MAAVYLQYECVSLTGFSINNTLIHLHLHLIYIPVQNRISEEVKEAGRRQQKVKAEGNELTKNDSDCLH